MTCCRVGTVMRSHMQVMQALQDADLVQEGLCLRRVLALEHLHRHQRPMPPRLVHLRARKQRPPADFPSLSGSLFDKMDICHLVARYRKALNQHSEARQRIV